MPTLDRQLRTRLFAGAAALIALIAIPPAAFAQAQFTLLHSFNGADGFGPMAGVIQGTDGPLYGTTSGQVDSPIVGTVFRLDRTTMGLTTLHSFTDGSRLFSGLTFGSDGLLYGSTYSGGTDGLGTLFRVGPDGQNYASLYSFSGGEDGARPDDAKLTQASDGSFYGTTSEGGIHAGGTLFRLDPVAPALTTPYSFTGTAGVDAGLMAGPSGYWYGTTYSGGAHGLGSVFEIAPDSTIPTTLHDFTGPDGANPVPGALMQGRDGNLYGTTQLGGGGYGTVFKLDPATGDLTTLHTFSAINDGRMPLGGVTEGTDGYLYGTTVLGGQGYGTVYRVHPKTLAYNIVYLFGGPNGRSPSGNLLLGDDGALYGVTRLGGAANAGTVFRLSSLVTPPPDTAPPVITSITAAPSVLKPANGKMVPVTSTVVATDAVDPAPKCKIIGVTSDQSIIGDWIITGDLTLNLRAKRSGQVTRIYTIAVQCTDASGNSKAGTVNVTVPK